jgi:hypothetical protein
MDRTHAARRHEGGPGGCASADGAARNFRTATPEPKALPITKFAAAYGIHTSTVWRALKEGRLSYVVVGKRKLVLLPVVRKDKPSTTA